MKRMMVLAGLAICLSLGISSAAVADPPNGVQPACADIVDPTGAGYDGTTVGGAVFLAAPACTNVSYTLVVFTYGANGFVSSISRQTLTGADALADDPTIVAGYGLTLAHPTQYVCAFFVSSRGLRIYDVAPDNGCPLRIDVAHPDTIPFNVLTADSSGGGGTFH